MNLFTKTRKIVLLPLLFATAAFAQTSQPIEHVGPMASEADPAFEVASIRPDKPDVSPDTSVIGRHITSKGYSITTLICLAYSVHKSQVIGLPPSLDAETYDIDGVPDLPGEPSVQQVQKMFQKLLTDRFGLKFHREQRVLSVYAMTLAKGGAKLTPASRVTILPSMESTNSNGVTTMKASHTSISEFALEMLFEMGKPVVDQTGLTGRYDFTLRWTDDHAPPSTDPNAPPGFFTAVQEQLGLKMEPTKATTDVLVVDHAAPPSDN